ncbi:MAG: hypothetical protein COV36_02550 [Alphaproteobacteria bacterium CG11_big_fil_rev_8_21_14_0_20_44_7]|nr:MAG: hypothetical protein COV36_02550 [Alphaproteobacteria bacterium CG11_big_fil_rev_8_21_14_0_20_44_7]
MSINKTNHDQTLIRAIIRSYKWNKMLDSGEVKSAREIAEKENAERTYASDLLKLKFLAPEIIAMILNGTQPRTLNLTSLTDQKIPMCWRQQKQLLNIA